MVQTIKLTEAKLYEMFVDPATFLGLFIPFFPIPCARDTWDNYDEMITNINTGINHLAFDYQTNHIWAKVKDCKTRLKCYVIKDIFDQVVKGVKCQYSRASDKINMVELHMHLP